MKVAVIGSRGFADYEKVKDYLGRLNAKRKIALIVSGGADGADSLGERWADENGVQKLIFEAKWDDLTHPDARIKVNSRGKKYDANAGFRRNRDIVDNCDVVLAFWDGRSPGTKNSIDYARSKNKPLKIISY
jgi:hypothetical protein